MINYHGLNKEKKQNKYPLDFYPGIQYYLLKYFELFGTDLMTQPVRFCFAWFYYYGAPLAAVGGA